MSLECNNQQTVSNDKITLNELIVNKKESWRLWCRLCAKEDIQGNISVLFKNQLGSTQTTTNGNIKTEHEHENSVITKALYKFFNIELTTDDHMSKVLCTECYSLVNSIINFSKYVLRVQQMFNEFENTIPNDISDNSEEIRKKYGLLDSDREQILSLQTSMQEVHYFQAKPKINVLQEKSINLETIYDNSLENTSNKQNQVELLNNEKKELHDNKNDGAADDDNDDDDGVDDDDNDNEVLIDEEIIDEIDDCVEEEDYLDEEEQEEEVEHLNEIEENEEDPFLDHEITSEEYDKEKEQLITSPVNIISVENDNEKVQNKIAKKRRRCTKPRLSPDDENSKELQQTENTQKNMLIYQCNECPRKFKLIQHFRQHMSRTHLKAAPVPSIKCNQCTRTFTTQYQMDKHVKVHLPLEMKKTMPCLYCDKKFTSATLVRSHIKHIHMDERPFICEECGVAVRTNAALKTHMLTHTDYAPFECEICRKAFKNHVRLKNHLETHDPNKHICAECGLQLNSRATLNRHLLVHSDKMSHICDYCGRAFKRAKALKNHLILHTGLKPYSCDFCERTFANGSNCRSHKKKYHAEELAVLEAAGGGRTYTKNIPKLAALKAVTKSADNLTPVVSKKSGRFSNGKKSLNIIHHLAIENNTRKLNSLMRIQTRLPLNTVDGSQIDVHSLHSANPDTALVGAAVAAASGNVATTIPTIDNIYSHIMKQATIAAAAKNAHTVTRDEKARMRSNCIQNAEFPMNTTTMPVAETNNINNMVSMQHHHSLQHDQLQSTQHHQHSNHQQLSNSVNNMGSSTVTSMAATAQQIFTHIVRHTNFGPTPSIANQQLPTNILPQHEDIHTIHSTDSRQSLTTNNNNNNTISLEDHLNGSTNSTTPHFYNEMRSHMDAESSTYM